MPSDVHVPTGGVAVAGTDGSADADRGVTHPGHAETPKDSAVHGSMTALRAKGAESSESSKNRPTSRIPPGASRAPRRRCWGG